MSILSSVYVDSEGGHDEEGHRFNVNNISKLSKAPLERKTRCSWTWKRSLWKSSPLFGRRGWLWFLNAMWRSSPDNTKITVQHCRKGMMPKGVPLTSTFTFMWMASESTDPLSDCMTKGVSVGICSQRGHRNRKDPRPTWGWTAVKRRTLDTWSPSSSMRLREALADRKSHTSLDLWIGIISSSVLLFFSFFCSRIWKDGGPWGWSS